MIKEYDVVRLTRQMESAPLPAGTTGTVLMIFEGDPPSYMVEFMNESEDSLGTFIVQAGDLAAAT